MEHIRTHFPRSFASLGENTVRQAIALGVEKARKHGIVSERDVCKFISSMFALSAQLEHNTLSTADSEIRRARPLDSLSWQSEYAAPCRGLDSRRERSCSRKPG